MYFKNFMWNKFNFYFIYFLMALILWLNLNFFEKKTLVVFFSIFDYFESLNFVDFLVSVDWVAIMFMIILFMMTFSVGSFSLNYMEGDYKKARFFFILNLFVVSMVVLMMIPHYLFFLMGWDGLGFSSFLLMNYYKSAKAWKSSMKTFLIKRLGDGMILGSVGLVLVQGHFFFFFENLTIFLFVLVVLGLFTKSAQYPFSMWLPAAMAAPTPVSALVHSSTLVTAGMYVIIRLLYYFPKSFLYLISVMGVVTVFLGSMKAFTSFDSKKVVAFSTLSNLGLMVVSLGLGMVGLSFFHLVNHGISKALLFMSVGSCMFKNFHNQDLRHFSNVNNSKNFSKFVGLWSNLCLMGVFYLSVFYSKDYVLEAKNSFFLKNLMVVVFFFFSVIFTFLYTFRFLKFWGKKSKKFFFFFFPTMKKVFSYFSEVFLFIGLLIVGKGLKVFFLSFSSNSGLMKVYLIVMFFLVFLKMSSSSFSIVQNFKYFNGSLWAKVSGLGTFFFEVLDKGLFLGMKYLSEKGFNLCFSFKKIKSLKYFFFFKSMLFSLVSVICMLMFVVL